MEINEFDQVQYVGQSVPESGLMAGEVGYVVEDYSDGYAEVEFSLPDGSTWLQCALPKVDLISMEKMPANSLTLLSRDVILPAIKQHEATGKCDKIYPLTGEVLKVAREQTNLLISTDSLGTIIKVVRPLIKIT